MLSECTPCTPTLHYSLWYRTCIVIYTKCFSGPMPGQWKLSIISPFLFGVKKRVIVILLEELNLVYSLRFAAVKKSQLPPVTKQDISSLFYYTLTVLLNLYLSVTEAPPEALP